MPPLAYTALTASIVLSALGAVVICLLTAFYGFTREGEESPARAARRTLLTRVGHAVAAACFAGTAILLAVVVSQPPRSPATPAADARVPALDAKIDAQIQRLHGVEQRMKDSEQTLERLEMEVSEATARRMGPAAALTDAPAKGDDKPVPAAKAATRSRTAVTAPKPSAPSAAKPADRPGTVTLPAERPVPSVSPPPPISAPAERAFAPKPLDEPAASPGPPPAAPAPVPPPSSRAPAPRSGESSPTSNDVRSKFQNDWQAIQRGWDRAADDFRRALAPLRKTD
jgi:hypothetical protein